jgi:hypothetical protein
MAFFLEGCIFFLNSSRIQNDYREQFFGCGGQQYFSSKPFFDKLRNKSGVVLVNMGEEKILDLVWRNGEGFPVSVGIVSFLKLSAIDEDLGSNIFQ